MCCSAEGTDAWKNYSLLAFPMSSVLTCSPTHSNEAFLIEAPDHRRPYSEFSTPEKEARDIENWAQSLIVVSLLAITCLFMPSVAMFGSNLSKIPMGIIFNLPGINQFSLLTTEFSPDAQLALSVSILSLGMIFSPVFLAGVVGTIARSYSDLFAVVCIFLVGRAQVSEIKDEYGGLVREVPFIVGIIAPIIEELIFRVFLPLVYEVLVEWTFTLVEKLTGNDYSSNKEWLINKTRIIFCAFLFGLAHYSNKTPLAFFQTLYTGFKGVRLYHALYENEGVLASSGAHIFQNTTLLLL